MRLLVVILAVAVLAACSSSEQQTGAQDASPPAAADDSTANRSTAPAADASEQSTGMPGISNGLPRLVDLGATSCMPCKMMAPILDELEQEYEGRLEVVFIDVWENRAAAKTYGITTIPTQILYDAEGQERWRHVGFIGKAEILAAIDEAGVEIPEAATE
jgi:thioredoxin 1